ncbi:hypothetical protein ATANTOWER_026500 [Ataeniobius toweri]|uniref:Uncharacterized protein n=1 Tax=Ataeniobius toweri TaxID=208326 RepID=A0ABU7BJQ1_9TELE|nr:hypothetical protein [Ataeniobius toweri]
MLCMEASPTISSRYLLTSRTSSGSFPPSEVTFHIPRASLSIRRSGRQGLHLRLPPNPLCTGPSWFPLQVVGPLGDGLASLVRAGPGWIDEQPSHQALSDQSRPQAWLQGGTLAPLYRAMSRTSILWSS